MSVVQKIIKYFAIAFAFFLSFSIISALISVFMAFGNWLDYKKDGIFENLETIEILDADTISSLDIDVSGVNIWVKVGERLQVQTNSRDIQVKQRKDNLSIKGTEDSWDSKGRVYDLVIYFPVDFTFQEVSINTGVGALSIEELSTKKMELDLGVGKVRIDKLIVFDQMKMDSGVGEVEIKDANLKNLDLNMGVGKFTLNAKLLGNCKVHHEVGEMVLNLIGGENDYQIHFNKGLGSVTIQEDEILDNQTIGVGSNYIDIDGGIGKIDIHFA